LATKLTKKMQMLQKAELAVAVKEDLKTVALGTSKINYMDPRITIAWCKRNEVGVLICHQLGGRVALGRFITGGCGAWITIEVWHSALAVSPGRRMLQLCWGQSG
jgi:hypothetical protein